MSGFALRPFRTSENTVRSSLRTISMIVYALDLTSIMRFISYSSVFSGVGIGNYCNDLKKVEINNNISVLTRQEVESKGPTVFISQVHVFGYRLVVNAQFKTVFLYLIIKIITVIYIYFLLLLPALVTSSELYYVFAITVVSGIVRCSVQVLFPLVLAMAAPDNFPGALALHILFSGALMLMADPLIGEDSLVYWS